MSDEASCTLCPSMAHRILHSSWYAFSMFVVFGGGNLSTDSPVRRLNCLSSLVKVPTVHQVSVDRNLEPQWYYERGSVLWPGIFPITRCQPDTCHGRHWWRPDPGWCQVPSKLATPLGCATTQSWLLLPKTPGSHHQEMLCRLTCWQLKLPAYWLVTWLSVWVTNIEVYRHWWPCIQWCLHTTTHSLIALETDQVVSLLAALQQRSLFWFELAEHGWLQQILQLCNLLRSNLCNLLCNLLPHYNSLQKKHLWCLHLRFITLTTMAEDWNNKIIRNW